MTLDEILRLELDDIAILLNTPLKHKGRAFGKESKKNVPFEWKCILMCEVGELGSEVLAYHAPVEVMNEWMNEFGLLGGLTLGFGYALWHVVQHGRKHDRQTPLRDLLPDALMYAGSTESSCVGSATGVEYLAGKLLTSNVAPFSGMNLLVRGLGLLPAFGLGLVAMSSLTFYKQREVARFVGEPNSLAAMSGVLEDFLDGCTQPLEYVYDGKGKIILTGQEGYMMVEEHTLPRSQREKFREKSMYVASSSVARYLPRMRSLVGHAVSELFETTGHPVKKITNVFAHT